MGYQSIATRQRSSLLAVCSPDVLNSGASSPPGRLRQLHPFLSISLTTDLEGESYRTHHRERTTGCDTTAKEITTCLKIVSVEQVVDVHLKGKRRPVQVKNVTRHRVD